MSSLYVPTRRFIYTTLGRVGKLLRLQNQKIFILCYHSIDDSGWDFSISPSEFTKQMTFLASKYQFISLSDVDAYIKGKKRIEKPSVVITFDDGYKNIMQINSVIQKLGIKPTVFVISNTKSVSRKELGTDKAFLSNKDILQLHTDGWEIGCHTATHANMESLNDAEVVQEIIDSKKHLEAVLKIPIRDIAFPKGRYTSEIMNAVKKVGYRLGLTMNDGDIVVGTDGHKIPRIGVDGTHSFEEFVTLPTKLVVSLRILIKSYGYGK